MIMMLIVSLFVFFNVDVFGSNNTQSCDGDQSSNICLFQKLKTLEQELTTSQSEVLTLKKAVETLQAQGKTFHYICFIISKYENDLYN